MITNGKMKFKYISFLKGIAMAMIIIVHSAQPFTLLPKYIVYPTIYGQMGTQLFFVISGYLLSCHIARYKNTKYWKYLARKFCKFSLAMILASLLYYLCNSICQFLIGTTIYDPKYSLWNITCNVLLLQQINVFGLNSIVPGSWYISCLWVFYIIFPYVFRLCKKLYEKSSYFMYVACIICSFLAFLFQIILSAIYDLNLGNNTFLYFSFINQLPALIVGCFLYQDNGKEKEKRPNCFLYFTIWTLITLVVMYINRPISFVICITTTSFSFYWLFYGIRQCTNKKKTNCVIEHFCKMGDNSLGIYIIHIIFVWYVPFIVLSMTHITSQILSMIFYFIFLILWLRTMPFLGKIYNIILEYIEEKLFFIASVTREKGKRK